jgi:hypothetical protein
MTTQTESLRTNMDKVAKFSSSILTIKSLIEEKFEDWGKVVSHICSVTMIIIPNQDLSGDRWKEQGILVIYQLKKGWSHHLIF